MTEGGYPVSEVARRLGTTNYSLYAWPKKYGASNDLSGKRQIQNEEIKRLRSELKRVTKERDILKKVTAYFAKESR